VEVLFSIKTKTITSLSILGWMILMKGNQSLLFSVLMVLKKFMMLFGQILVGLLPLVNLISSASFLTV